MSDIRAGDVWEKGEERRYVRGIETNGPGNVFIKFNRLMLHEICGTNMRCRRDDWRAWEDGAKLIRRTDLDEGEEEP